MTAGKQSCQQSSPVSYLQTPCSWLLYCCPGYSLIPAATCLRPDSSSRPRCQWRWHVLSTHRARGAQTRCTRVTAYRAATPWHHYSYTHRLRGTKGCQGTVGFEHQSSWILGPWSIGSISSGSAGNEEDPGWIPESGRSPGEGNGNPLQYSCLENAMDRGAWWATVHGVAESQIRLSDLHSDTCLPSDVTCPAQGPVITHLGLTFPSSSSHTTTWHSAWPAELFWHWLYRISCSRLEITHPLQVLTSWPDSQVPPGLCEPYLSPPPHALYASAKLDSLFLWCVLVLAPLCLFALPPLKKTTLQSEYEKYHTFSKNKLKFDSLHEAFLNSSSFRNGSLLLWTLSLSYLRALRRPSGMCPWELGWCSFIRTPQCLTWGSCSTNIGGDKPIQCV